MNRGEELKPGFKKTTLMPIKGKRQHHVAHQDPSNAGGHLHGQHSSAKFESVHNPGHARTVL